MFYLTTHSTHFIAVNQQPWSVPTLSLITAQYLCLHPINVQARCPGQTEREREMFYLTTHSTHFIAVNQQPWSVPTLSLITAQYLCLHPINVQARCPGQTEREREMFYLTTHLNTFYLRLYGVRHMIKDHSDSERGNPLPPHRLLLLINSKGSFICTIPQTG